MRYGDLSERLREAQRGSHDSKGPKVCHNYLGFTALFTHDDCHLYWYDLKLEKR